MSLIKVLTLAKDVAVAGAKGFWNTPVDIGVAGSEQNDSQNAMKHQRSHLDGFRALNGDPVVKEFTVIKPASSH